MASVRSRIAEAVVDQSKGVAALSESIQHLLTSVPAGRGTFGGPSIAFATSRCPPASPRRQPVWWAFPASACTTIRHCSKSRAAGLRLGTKIRVTGHFGAGARDHVDAPRRPDGRDGREHELRSWELPPRPGRSRGFSDGSQTGGEQLVDGHRLDVVNYGPLAAGDATFHAGWTMHRAEENTSSAMREVMTVTYFPDGMRVEAPENRRQASDLARWLPGFAPGDLAASELNPVLYRENG